MSALRLVVVGDPDREAFRAFHRDSGSIWVVPLEDAEFDALVTAHHLFGLDDGGPVGLVYLNPASSHVPGAAWELGGVFVAPSARGRGLASLLCTVAIAAGRAASPAPVTAMVQPTNGASMRLLQHLGFVDTGERAMAGPDRFVGFLDRDERGFATAAVLQLPAGPAPALADRLDALAGSGAVPGVAEAIGGDPAAVAERLRSGEST